MLRFFTKHRAVWWSLVFLALAAAQGLTFHSTLDVSESTAWVAHTHEVLSRLQSTLSTFQDAETGQRGYLITGDERYLQPYLAAMDSVGERIDHLKRLTADNPRQQAYLAELSVVADKRFAELRKTIDLRRQYGFEAARAVVMTDLGERAMQGMRGIITNMIGVEERLLVVRQNRATHIRSQGIVDFASLTALNLAVVGICFMRASRYAADRRDAERRFHRQSLHDSLTGLPNRLLFRRRVTQCLRAARQVLDGEYHYAVLYVDLDRFKAINDAMGHAAGDRLLRSVASRLKAGVRAEVLTDDAGKHRRRDTVARLGGDEFALLLQGLQTPQEATIIAQRLLRDLSLPYEHKGQKMVTTPSIGIALGGPQYRRPDELIGDADTAMYHAKTTGRARWATFEPAMRAAEIERLNAEAEARRAVEQAETNKDYRPAVLESSHYLPPQENRSFAL